MDKLNLLKMNLLPEENKILFKKHYLKRLLVVLGIFIFSIIAAGALVLTPMYLLVLSYKNYLRQETKSYLQKDVKLADSAVALEIKNLNSRLKLIENMGKEKKLNLIFKDILDSKNPGVRIISFSYEKSKKTEIYGKLSLAGTAKTREDLLIFEGRLKKEFGDQGVVSPVSNLINEKDLVFSLVLNF